MSDDPWAVPASPAGRPYIGPPYESPGHPSPRGRSRSLVWIVAVIVVIVLAISGTGIAVIYDRHHGSRSAAAAPATSSKPQTSASAPASALPSVAPSAAASAPPVSPSAPSASGLGLTPTPPAGGAAPGAGSGPLDQYLLAPAEVGANTAMYLIDGGRSTTSQATLDWCNFSYTSEKLRAARVQVEYTGDDLHPSGNEFVRYQAGGTTKAYAEIQRAVATCPATSQTDGYTYSQVQRAPRDATLATRQLVLSFQVIDPTGQLDLQWQAIVYQFNGNFFSGVYVYGLTRSSALTAAEQLAAISARHLAQAATGKPGTGGGPFQTLSSPPDTGIQD
jgi:hypothetical protein